MFCLKSEKRLLRYLMRFVIINNSPVDVTGLFAATFILNQGSCEVALSGLGGAICAKLWLQFGEYVRA
jgi:hypothetical protein